jgi:hypothetical protein
MKHFHNAVLTALVAFIAIVFTESCRADYTIGTVAAKSDHRDTLWLQVDENKYRACIATQNQWQSAEFGERWAEESGRCKRIVEVKMRTEK